MHCSWVCNLTGFLFTSSILQHCHIIRDWVQLWFNGDCPACGSERSELNKPLNLSKPQRCQEDEIQLCRADPEQFWVQLNRTWISGHRKAFGEDLASLYNRGPEELKWVPLNSSHLYYCVTVTTQTYMPLNLDGCLLTMRSRAFGLVCRGSVLLLCSSLHL